MRLSDPVAEKAMPRVKGKRRQDYNEKRTALLVRLSDRLKYSSDRASFRDLAAAALVSVPTLRHYFGNRDGLIQSYFQYCHDNSVHHAARGAVPDGPLDQSLLNLLTSLHFGLVHYGLARLQMLGFREGMYHPTLGPAYLEFFMEPLIGAVEKRLAGHQARGELRPCSLRHAAVALLSPLLIADFHQHEFGGETVRKMDVDVFIRDHTDAFVRAYGMGKAEN